MQQKDIVIDDQLADFISDLSKQRNVICEKVLNILQNESLSERMFTVEKQLLPLRYRRYIKNLAGDTSIILRRNRLVHLLQRGHLTGKALHGENDGFPLSAGDFMKLQEIFMKPNSVVMHSNYLEISKWVNGKPLRLVVRPNKKFSKLDIVSFYNYAPKDIKDAFLGNKK